MTGATLTIGGAFNSQVGIVSVPSSFLGDTSSTSGSLNSLLENYLVSLTSSIQGSSTTGATYAFENNDVAAGPGNDFVTAPASGSVSGSLEEFTNTNSSGSVTGGSVSGAYTVSSGVTDVMVQAPGNTVLVADPSVKFALFGAGSDVGYIQSTGGSASIVAAGGKNTIDIVAASVNDTVWSAGNDLISFNGTDGNNLVNAEGDATTTVLIGGSDAATVTASDNAAVNVQFFQRAGGSLDFINNSTQAQTVFSGAFGAGYAPNSITVNAGAGGGYFVGGRGGNNSLAGGTGAVTLVGGGVGDTLIGASSATTAPGGISNYLFGGAGAQTLLGATGSGTNVFQIGVYAPGMGTFQASGLVSTEGSGSQYFVIGNTNGETITGSNATGANNVYDILGTNTTGGSSLTITNFGQNSQILLVDSTLGAGGDASIAALGTPLGGGGTEIVLSDNTTILLKGVSSSHVGSVAGANGLVFINYH